MRKRTIIFGGSFDPVHLSHLRIIEELSKRFDKVIIVPCKLSPFKHSAPVSDVHRREMLRRGIVDIRAEISVFELESAQPNYSYITAEHFASAEEELYMAIGSEMVAGIKQWKNFARLSELVTFYIIPRQGFPLDRKRLDANKSASFEVADFDGGGASSSEVKISVAMGEPEMFLPKGIAEYVIVNNLYREYCYVNNLYKKYNLSTSRVRHSYSTALCSVTLAKKLNVDIHKAITASLLHDIGKQTTVEEAERLGIRLDSIVSKLPDNLRHAEVGAEILSQLEGITDCEIIDAVRWHTTGRANMTGVEIVVYLADLIEPFRSYNGVDTLRKLAENDVMSGFLEALRRTICFIGENDVNSNTIEAYKYYKEKY